MQTDGKGGFFLLSFLLACVGGQWQCRCRGERLWRRRRRRRTAERPARSGSRTHSGLGRYEVPCGTSMMYPRPQTHLCQLHLLRYLAERGSRSISTTFTLQKAPHTKPATGHSFLARTPWRIPAVALAIFFLSAVAAPRPAPCKACFFVLPNCTKSVCRSHSVAAHRLSCSPRASSPSVSQMASACAVRPVLFAIGSSASNRERSGGPDSSLPSTNVIFSPPPSSPPPPLRR